MSMGSISARHARTVLEHVERIVAIELLVAAQALDLRLAPPGGPGAGVARPTRRLPASSDADVTASRAGSSRPPSATRPSRAPDLAALRRPWSTTAAWSTSARAPSRSRRLVETPAMAAIRIVDVTDEAAFAPDPALRRPGLRPPHVRLLGGRRPRLEGGPPRLARTGSAAADAAGRRPREPVRRPGRRAAGQPVRPARRRGRRSTLSRRDDDGRSTTRSPRSRRAPASGATPRASSASSAAGWRCSGATPRSSSSTTSPSVYAQFGPLSAYPRAQRLRELYPQLPDAPLPAVITCIATTARGARRGPRRGASSRPSATTWPVAASRRSRPTRSSAHGRTRRAPRRRRSG